MASLAVDTSQADYEALLTASVLKVWGTVVGGATLKGALILPVKIITGRISIDNNFYYGLFFCLVVAIFVFLAQGGERKIKLSISSAFKLVFSSTAFGLFYFILYSSLFLF